MKLFNKTIQLINVTYTKDNIGQQQKQYSYRKIYAKQKSVSQSEFFSVGQSDIKPSSVFIVRTGEYKGEKMLMYNGIKYSIYRTYDTKNEMTELYAEIRKGEK